MTTTTIIRDPNQTREIALEDGFQALDEYRQAVERGDQEAAAKALALLDFHRSRAEG